MLALWERSPRTLRDISDALKLEPATVTPLLKRLEASGYLSRDRSTADPRALSVELTPTGLGLRERAIEVPGTIVDKLGMPLAELERIRDDLTTLIAAAATVR
jgi:DNA-binding MarR family transcriptional regulator